MNKINFKLLGTIFLSFLMLLCSVLFSQPAGAEEIGVSGNGESSTSEVTAHQASAQDSTSQNTTTIDNDSVLDATTGGNTISGTQGTAQIQSGSIETNTTIENSANTTTQTTTSCCKAQGTIVIVSGNGTGSKKTADNPRQTGNSTTTEQQTSLTNTIVGSASTGYNTARDNSGSVTIQTGDVSVSTTIKNGPVNFVRIDPLTGKPHESLVIKDNGASSSSGLTYNEETTTEMHTTSIADIMNDVLLSLTTGDNDISGSRGDALIRTGDIVVTTLIVNGPINDTKLADACKCTDKPIEVPLTPAPDKVTTPSSLSEKTLSNTSGEVASISFEKQLPVTGMNWLLLAFMGNVMMLLLGMILRLRSGNAPGVITKL